MSVFVCNFISANFIPVLKKIVTDKNTIFPRIQTLNCRGKLLSLDSPIVFGILNLTPDSFYDGGRYDSLDAALKQTEKMLNEGADVIDAGAYSSRPNAKDISEEEEIKRLGAVIETIVKKFDAVVSIDTFRLKVAEYALQQGASIINDISGGMHDAHLPDGQEKIFELAGKNSAPLVIMHMKGTPQTMMNETQYDDLVMDVANFFERQIQKAKSHNVHDIILDVGFGFAKNMEQNYFLLKNLNYFKMYGYPLMAGLSRKSMIYKKLSVTPAEALNGTTVLNTIALMNGASVLRVHDVKEAKEAIALVQECTRAELNNNSFC